LPRRRRRRVRLRLPADGRGTNMQGAEFIHLSIYAVFVLFWAPVCLALLVKSDLVYRTFAVTCYALCGLAILSSALIDGLTFQSQKNFHDLWVTFEAINKAAHGISASLDYYSPIGPAYGWVLGLALELRGISVAVLPLASAAVGASCAICGFVMLRRSVSPLAMAMTVLIAVATVLSPREIDLIFARADMSFLAPYNRWGWGVLVIVVMRLAAPVPARDVAGGVALGVAIAFLLLLKVTYGAAALGLLAVATLVRPQGWRDGLTGIAVAGVCLALAQVATGQLVPHAADLAATARMQESGIRLQLVRIVGEVGIYVAVSLILLVMLFVLRDGERSWLRNPDVWRSAILILAAGGAGMVVLMQNHYVAESLVSLLLPVIAFEWAGSFGPARDTVQLVGRGEREADKNALRFGAPANKAMFLIAGLLILRLPLADLGAVLAQTVETRRIAPHEEFAGTPLAGLRVHPKTLSAGRCAGYCVNSCSCPEFHRLVSGQAMLAKAGLGGEPAARILALSFANPFPMLLDRPSPRHSPLWFDEGRSISEKVHPAPETLFDGVDYVMAARQEANGIFVRKLYSNYLETWFTVVDENEDWTLMRRRAAVAGQGA